MQHTQSTVWLSERPEHLYQDEEEENNLPTRQIGQLIQYLWLCWGMMHYIFQLSSNLYASVFFLYIALSGTTCRNRLCHRYWPNMNTTFNIWPCLPGKLWRQKFSMMSITVSWWVIQPDMGREDDIEWKESERGGGTREKLERQRS